MAHQKFDDLSSMAQDVLRSLVGRAEAKLAALHKRRIQLRKRIQALNYLTKTFEKPAPPPRSTDWPFSQGAPGDEPAGNATESIGNGS